MLKGVNSSVSQKQAEEFVAKLDKNNNKMIEYPEFEEGMLVKLKEEIISQQDSMADLRKMFKEADADHSNFLSMVELQKVLQQLGVDLNAQQMKELMSEMDLDSNANVDIDEFIAFLSVAEQLKFKNPGSKSVMINIRRSRKLKPLDFYDMFKNLPPNYCPSFLTDRFEKHNSNLPSANLKPEYDSKAMTYKDLMWLGQQKTLS